jgi:hypothetical protein
MSHSQTSFQSSIQHQAQEHIHDNSEETASQSAHSGYADPLHRPHRPSYAGKLPLERVDEMGGDEWSNDADGVRTGQKHMRVRIDEGDVRSRSFDHRAEGLSVRAQLGADADIGDGVRGGSLETVNQRGDPDHDDDDDVLRVGERVHEIRRRHAARAGLHEDRDSEDHEDSEEVLRLLDERDALLRTGVYSSEVSLTSSVFFKKMSFHNFLLLVGFSWICAHVYV